MYFCISSYLKKYPLSHKERAMIPKRSGYLILLLLGAATSLSAQKREFAIERYTFSWHFTQISDIQLDVVKDQTKVWLVLRQEGFQELSFEAEEALAIGRALLQANKHFAKKRGSQKYKSENVEAGGHTVSFRTGTYRGPRVAIIKRLFIGSKSISMDEESAEHIGQALLEARDMIAFFEKKVAL